MHAHLAPQSAELELDVGGERAGGYWLGLGLGLGLGLRFREWAGGSVTDC